MIRVVKEVAIAIKESKMDDVHPELYGVVMEQIGFSREALMVALSHLLDNKAEGVGFVAMGEAQRGKWYAMFEGRVPGIYRSWEGCSNQVSGYNNQSHKGFKTWYGAEDSYSKHVLEEGCGKVEVVNVDRRFGLKTSSSSSSSSPVQCCGASVLGVIVRKM
ncbi:Translational activator GCN1 [Hordeum vulgare]|nr:Translational activator GCN1 [Hordeum vulgare]